VQKKAFAAKLGKCSDDRWDWKEATQSYCSSYEWIIYLCVKSMGKKSEEKGEKEREWIIDGRRIELESKKGGEMKEEGFYGR
jgi:hypothetical protein